MNKFKKIGLKKIVLFVSIALIIVSSIFLIKDRFFNNDLNVTLRYGNSELVTNTPVTVRSYNGIRCASFTCPTNRKELFTVSDKNGKIVIPADIVQFEVVVIVDERRNILAGFNPVENKKDYVLIISNR